MHNDIDVVVRNFGMSFELTSIMFYVVVSIFRQTLEPKKL